MWESYSILGLLKCATNEALRAQASTHTQVTTKQPSK